MRRVLIFNFNVPSNSVCRFFCACRCFLLLNVLKCTYSIFNLLNQHKHCDSSGHCFYILFFLVILLVLAQRLRLPVNQFSGVFFFTMSSKPQGVSCENSLISFPVIRRCCSKVEIEGLALRHWMCVDYPCYSFTTHEFADGQIPAMVISNDLAKILEAKCKPYVINSLNKLFPFL